MTSTLTLRKATRQKTKIRIGLSGPSGSGKTYSALLIASGMAPWDKIALIDTENGSGDLYADLGSYSVITLSAPYTPERYIEAIKACETARMEVIIIDSATHEWEGNGGCLESNELLGQTRFKGNNWAAWSVTTPRHQKFIEAIVTSSSHIITTARSKTDTIQTEDKKIKKVGLKEIQREGFEYELTLNFTLDRDGHYATASKDRTGIFINRDPFKITPETGKMILDWAASGVEPLPVEPPIVPVIDARTKLPPTAVQVMEELTKCVGLPPLQQFYDVAFDKYVWSKEDGEKITSCFLACYAKIQKWTLVDGQFWKDTILKARVGRDDSGKAAVILNAAAAALEKPIEVTMEEEKAMGDAERAGMQAV